LISAAHVRSIFSGTNRRAEAGLAFSSIIIAAHLQDLFADSAHSSPKRVARNHLSSTMRLNHPSMKKKKKKKKKMKKDGEDGKHRACQISILLACSWRALGAKQEMILKSVQLFNSFPLLTKTQTILEL